MDLNTITIGHDVEEAIKYTKYYRYIVSVSERQFTENKFYKFKMVKIGLFNLSKPEKRFSYTTGYTRYCKITFTFKPKKRFSYTTGYTRYCKITFTFKPKIPREIIDDKMYVFKPFNITFTTKECYDFNIYHTPKTTDGNEVAYGIHILNVDSVIKKLKEEIYPIYDLSENAKTSMVGSVIKHLSDVHTAKYYGIIGYDKYDDHTEETALMIIDEFGDKELLNSLIDYIE